MLNRFPYNNGHLLVAPARHIADFSETSEDEMLELVKLVRETQRALSLAISPHGFNVGLNFGRCAGAGLPGHMHIHVVPRWDGDTNFMSVCSDTKVVSQSLADLLAELKKASAEHGLPVSSEVWARCTVAPVRADWPQNLRTDNVTVTETTTCHYV